MARKLTQLPSDVDPFCTYSARNFGSRTISRVAFQTLLRKRFLAAQRRFTRASGWLPVAHWSRCDVVFGPGPWSSDSRGRLRVVAKAVSVTNHDVVVQDGVPVAVAERSSSAPRHRRLCLWGDARVGT